MSAVKNEEVLITFYCEIVNHDLLFGCVNNDFFLWSSKTVVSAKVFPFMVKSSEYHLLHIFCHFLF